MPFLDATTVMQSQEFIRLQALIETWVTVAQALVATIGALAFVLALTCMVR